MINFTCYPILITKVEGVELLSPKDAVEQVLASGDIPLKVLQDKNHTQMIELQNSFNRHNQNDLIVEYAIIVLRYNPNQFMT